MKASTAIVFIASCVLHVTCAHASPSGKPIEIKDGFLTVESYRQLSAPTKRGYVMGFVDAMLVSPVFGTPKREVVWLDRCVVGMSDMQLVAIVDKWLADNPSQWHYQMHFLVYSAIKQTCQH